MELLSVSPSGAVLTLAAAIGSHSRSETEKERESQSSQGLEQNAGSQFDLSAKDGATGIEF
jgi:hypothetical protein